ncbi:MAG: bifunctional fucokinase/fucose-1-phosphate guanylyltransferase [Terracidiphilus sp.]|nr:bifunctional fucokinase/fucose-1-phosphate guanylyltransferase [Terracidiphilus sp.]
MKSWDVVIVTASSDRQAGLYRDEIERRRLSGMLPAETEFLVVPDPEDRRVGSGGATIHALGVLGRDREWWNSHRALLIHSGGDSRRLPQYSPGGKLFGVLPSRTRPRATTTVFDETLSLSAAWAERIPNGLLVASGDVVLRFDASQVQLDRPGVTGIAMRLDAETGSHHGVYVVGAGDQVYTFLQKPTPTEVSSAGGVLEDGRVAVDIGLLRFDAETTLALAELAGFKTLPTVDLYDQITRGLTGQWKPESGAGLFWRELARILRAPERPAAFHCAVVEGEFIHAGTTRSFRTLAARSGGILDSVIGGACKAGHEAVILECDLSGPVQTGRGAILHGLTGLSGPVEVPEDTVVHQLPVEADGGGWVIRAYGVEDDPKQAFETATWFNRPILETLERLGLSSEEIWGASEERTLWNAALFPVATPDEAWACARWMMGYASGYGVKNWREAERLSLAGSARCADGKALAEARNHRLQGIWQDTVVELAESGTDLRPLLANLPGLAPAAAAGQLLRARAEELRKGSAENLTHAASLLMQASRLLDRAGYEPEAALAEGDAFNCIQDAVREGTAGDEEWTPTRWQFERVHVAAPPRIDLGGGWSDTPPFCFDWGGTVLNCAVEINGEYPIETEIRRIDEAVIRCHADGSGEVAEYRSAEELLEQCGPGSVFSIPRAAMQLHGIPVKGQRLEETLAGLGGGLDIQCKVRLPMGSGLGTSSILAATVIRALAAMSGRALSDHALAEVVMQLEQRMTTGGGWQDQAGSIFPGAKLLITGPGLRQRIRVQPVAWSAERRVEFSERMVLYGTGIQRMAKGLLRQVVSRYLARETATIQVLHSIKTLAVEMSYAMSEGDWKHLGMLMDRHWQLNQVLDPHTANAPINGILDRARPYLYGAKLAGAGGGGFLMLLARDVEAAAALRAVLAQDASVLGACVSYRIAEEGLRVQASS